MRILQINKFYFQGGASGGVGKYYFSLKKLLEENGHTVIPFAMQHPRNADTEYANFFVSTSDFSRVRFTPRTALRALYSRETYSKVKQLAQATKPDIAHIHLIYHQLSPSLLPALHELNVPTVMTVHDFKTFFPSPVISDEVEACNNPASYRATRFIRSACVNGSKALSAFAVFENWLHYKMQIYQKYVDLYIAPSHYVYEKLLTFGVPQERLIQIPHFIECTEPSEQHITTDYYGYLGRLAPEKDLLTLLEAHRRSGTALTLKIAGEGRMKHTLQNYISTHAIPRVELVGGLLRNQVDEFIAGAQFMVAPSSVGETFGMTILEAFCQGRPVIAADVGAYPEIVQPRENGFLYTAGKPETLASALRELTLNKNLRLEMGRRSGQTLKKYTPHQHLARIEAAYQNLVKIENIQA